MKHPLHHITSFDLVKDHVLRLRFADGLERTIDFRPALWGALYAPLHDPEEFRKVRLDPDFNTLTWDCGADFDPAILHDWPEHEAAWQARARQERMALH